MANDSNTVTITRACIDKRS